MRLALALPQAVAERLGHDAVRHGHEIVLRAGSSHELLASLDQARPTLLLVAAETSYLSESVVAACDDVGAAILALATTNDGRGFAARLGLYETADAAASWPELEAALDSGRASAVPALEPTPGAPRDSRGTVIAVWGPSGAPGRTTLAISIAAELAALGHSVALADVDTHGASVAPALGMLDEAPGFAAACRLAGSDSLTVGELERIGQRYRSSAGDFSVLTGIGRPSRWPELSAERVATTIDVCRTWVDFVVLDTASSLENDEEISSDVRAPRRNAATVTAVRKADRIVAVGSADPVGLSRFLRAHVDLIETASTADVTVVMNRVRASAVGMNPNGQILQTLSRFGGIDDPVLVPNDASALDGCVLSGRTLIDSAPRSPARAAIRDLVVGRLVPDAGARGARRGRLVARGATAR
jgi:Mrp family chromosome partitioning ATPase